MKKLILFMFYLGCQFSFSQLNQVPTDIKNINIKTPNVSDFIKYGNISSISNIGELNLNIPILSLPIPGQNPIGISLSYFGSGFRPGKRSGLVGYNWVLNAGGVISRTVNNVPDDQKGHANTWINDTNYADGFIIGVTNKTHNSTDVFNFSSSTSYEDGWSMSRYMYGNSSSTKGDVKNYEPDPDIFSFNFNGISGSFFMGNDGLIKVISNSPNNLKIDISELGFQEETSFGGKPKNSKIIITDDNGNKYYFGGELKNLEYSQSGSVLSNGKFETDNRPVINSWFLYKIECYNGFITNFNYRDDSLLPAGFASQMTAEHSGFSNINDSKRDFVVFHESYSQDNSTCTDPNVTVPQGSNSPTYSLQKIAILENITFDNFKIVFDYTRQPHVFNNRNSSTDFIPTNFSGILYNQFLDIKLDNIKLYDKNNNVINNYNLSYDHFGGLFNSRMFLNSIEETGKPPHRFEYFPTGTLPKPITYAIDHWGYWNGKNDNTNRLIPIVNYNWSTGDYTFENNIDGTSREADFQFALKGQLKKVIYPTAGYSEFEYEPHYYSKRLEIRSVNGFTPAIYDVNDVAGGTRIKKITDFDGLTSTNIKEYKYVLDYAINGTNSSGILFKWPRYHMYYSAAQISTAQMIYMHVRSNPIGNIIDNSPVIAYSEVTEKTTTNGFVVNKFSDFITSPDLLDVNFHFNRFPVNCNPQGLAINYMGDLMNDRSNERGKIIAEKIYDNNQILKQSSSYVYNIDSNKFNKFSTRLHISGPVTIANKIYYYNDYLTEKTTTLYTSSGNFISKENYTYISAPSYTTTMSNQDILSETSTTSSVNNEIIKTEYKYPWQNYIATSAEFLNFKSANIMYPIREIQYRNAVKLSEKFTFFAKDASTNSLLFPKSIYTAKFPNSFPNIINVGNLEKKFTYDSYDSKGNVSQYTQENGISVTIIWGYDKTQPIAKIENANLAQVAAALGTTTTTLQTTYNETNLSALNGLRSLLPSAMVTTYMYLPLIGVSKITDPKGDISTYTYDVNNRLKNVKDKNGNVLSEYQYHYKNE